MESFKEAYNQLNRVQKAAVDATEGAVLVIAGPGTGKTQLLSLRVANILNKSDSLPENILCLTFTNKAANNMQLRLSSLIGSAGQRVMIKTFHSFAAEVMNLYPKYFWNGASLVNVPDAVQLEIVTDILSTLPLDNPLSLKFAGQFTATGDVIKALRLVKEAGLTPGKLRSLIKLNMSYIEIIEEELIDICSERLNYKKLDELAMRIDELPDQQTDVLTRPLVSLSTVISESFEAAHTADDGTGKTKNTSAWKSRWIQSVGGVKGMYKERERNDWWLKLADVYEAYRENLHQRGYYDYSDMIIEVITQLEQNPDMLADIQERFHYVLIDEFQDTNAAQLRLAHLVADHEIAEGNPNIMAVGDDDQSIYKFNGAELSNMLDFERSYPKLKRFILTDNYRSSQEILDFSLSVIEQAEERIVTRDLLLTKNLISKNPPKDTGSIRHISYPTKEHEYAGLAEEVEKLHKQKPGEVAVLARSHDSLKSIAKALHSRSVPVRYEQQQNIMDQPLVSQVIQVCEIIHSLALGEEQNVNSLLPRLLAYPAWRVEPIDLWRLAIKNRRQPDWIESLVKSEEDNLQSIGHWFLWLAQISRSENICRMLEYIIGLSASEHLTSPLRQYYLEAEKIDSPYLTNISGIKKLISMADDFSAHSNPTLEDFIRLIKVAEDNNSNLSDESLFVTAPKAVELLTVHKAKGLEFDSVVIVDAMENIWKPTNAGRKPPANLPLRPSGDTTDDYIRLMFVAITRAKRNLIIGSYYKNDDDEPAVPSAIIRDILPGENIPYDDLKKAIDVIESSIRWPRLEGSQEHELLKNILIDFTLSPSAILDFLDVNKGGPQYFLEKYLLRLPEAQSPQAAFGTAIHASLESAQQQVTDNNFSLDLVLSSYEKHLQKQMLSSNNFERYLLHGQQVLTRLFEDYELELLPSGNAEMPVTVPLNGFIVGGKLDRVDESENSILVTDYKSGTPLSSFNTRDKNKAIKAWRHRTQLQFYVLMLKNIEKYKSQQNIEAQMLYVEADSIKDLIRKYTPSNDELDRLLKLTTAVAKKIHSLNLPDTRHYSEDIQGIINFEEDLLSGKI